MVNQGLVVILGDYAATVNGSGETYVVTWGTMVFGCIQAVRGFSNYVKINNTIAKAWLEIW